MSDTTNNTDKKRKRRSFWEPDSEKVVAWLDAQTDLGTTLQLVAVDAIRKYGEGDAIKAHLTQREHAAFDWEVQQGEPEPIRTPQPVQKPVQEMVLITTPKQEIPPVSEPAPELPFLNQNQDLDDDLDQTDESEEQEQPKMPEPDDFDVASAIAGAASEKDDVQYDDEDDDEAFDPIAIMMKDSGSKLNN